MKGKLVILLSLFLIISCNDEVTTSDLAMAEPRPDTGTVPNLPAPKCDEFQFSGVSKVDEIRETSVKLHWDAYNEAASFVIFKVVDGKKAFVATTKGTQNSYTVTGLKAGETYTYIVNVMNMAGKGDGNAKAFSVTTIPWEGYANNSSLYFSGEQSLVLPSSETLLPNDKKFTISIWFKTLSNQNGERLITFHNEASSDSSAVYLALGNNEVIFGYKNKSHFIKKMKYPLVYNSGNWHHLVGVFGHDKYYFYIDGKRRLRAHDTFAGFSSKVAYIGSYNGSRMNVESYIDEVSTWKTALSASAISEIFNGGSSFDLLRHSKQRKLTAWYRMGDGSGDDTRMIYDQKNNYNAIGLSFDPSDFSTDSP